MPFKIFAAPGDHKDDFAHVENQVNEWAAENNPHIIRFTTTVDQLPTKRETGQFMMALVIQYDQNDKN